jgi:hypothetical protein
MAGFQAARQDSPVALLTVTKCRLCRPAPRTRENAGLPNLEKSPECNHTGGHFLPAIMSPFSTAIDSCIQSSSRAFGRRPAEVAHHGPRVIDRRAPFS